MYAFQAHKIYSNQVNRNIRINRVKRDVDATTRYQRLFSKEHTNLALPCGKKGVTLTIFTVGLQMECGTFSGAYSDKLTLTRIRRCLIRPAYFRRRVSLLQSAFWVHRLFNVCVRVFCARNATILLVYIPAKIIMSFIWKDDFFLECKSITGTLSEAKTHWMVNWLQLLNQLNFVL